jgi:nucleotidyltransferase substrate binding protein (TIGR01987 family)
MIINGINIDALINSYKKFKQFYARVLNPQPSDDLELNDAGLIQGFEFCYERCWKVMLKLLKKEGHKPQSTKEIFRLAAKTGYIADPEVWFLFQDKRNTSSHVYSEDEMEAILMGIQQFETEAANFIKKIAGPDALN